LFDKPVYIDTNVAAQGSNAKTIWFGAASAFYIRTVGNPIIETDGSRYFDTDEVGFRAKWRVDSNYVDLTAANVIKQSV
jgi:HK97 family phage major capsid protein